MTLDDAKHTLSRRNASCTQTMPRRRWTPRGCTSGPTPTATATPPSARNSMPEQLQPALRHRGRARPHRQPGLHHRAAKNWCGACIPSHADIGWISLAHTTGTGASITSTTPFLRAAARRLHLCASATPGTGLFHHAVVSRKAGRVRQQGWHAMPYLTQADSTASSARSMYPSHCPRTTCSVPPAATRDAPVKRPGWIPPPSACRR